MKKVSLVAIIVTVVILVASVAYFIQADRVFIDNALPPPFSKPSVTIAPELRNDPPASADFDPESI